MMDAGIKGKVALITGAAQGIGEAVARTLAGCGAIVAAVDKNADKLEALASELRARGCQAAAFTANVGDSARVDETVEQVEKELGPIEILVHVAGVLRMGEVQSLSNEDWADTFSVNCMGVFYVSRSVARRMMLRRSGAIVTVGSNAAGTPRMGMSAYAASKAAATLFTQCLGLELARYNIRCNIVSPGSTETEMQWSLWTEGNGPESVIAGSPEKFRLGIPLGRLADPQDIAHAVLFLLSDAARHITLHNMCVDGGATLGA